METGLMKPLLRIVLFTALLPAMAACAPQTGQQGLNKQHVGTGAGALLGGLAGSQVGGGSGQLWATGAGALLGALAGSEIGKSLDRADKVAMRDATREAQNASIGDTISWSNPETGNYGYVTPVQEGQTETGAYCRKFRQTIVVDGREETATGTACRQRDGTWEIVR